MYVLPCSLATSFLFVVVDFSAQWHAIAIFAIALPGLSIFSNVVQLLLVRPTFDTAVDYHENQGGKVPQGAEQMPIRRANRIEGGNSKFIISVSAAVAASYSLSNAGDVPDLVLWAVPNVLGVFMPTVVGLSRGKDAQVLVPLLGRIVRGE